MRRCRPRWRGPARMRRGAGRQAQAPHRVLSFNALPLMLQNAECCGFCFEVIAVQPAPPGPNPPNCTAAPRNTCSRIPRCPYVARIRQSSKALGGTSRCAHKIRSSQGQLTRPPCTFRPRSGARTFTSVAAGSPMLTTRKGFIAHNHESSPERRGVGGTAIVTRTSSSASGEGLENAAVKLGRSA